MTTRSAKLLVSILSAATLAVSSACVTDHEPGAATPTTPHGNASHGKELIVSYGCGSCHEIPGVAKANGRVGPPLTDWPSRKIIAGRLPNNAANLARWVRDPQGIDPGVDMPNLGITVEESHDIAAYLLEEGNR